MSSCLEFEGKAVENAVQKASEELNIPKDKLRYNVVSHGSSGIFGLVGVKKARICVMLPDEAEAQPRKPEKNRPNRKKNPDEQTAGMASSLVEETFEEAPKNPPQEKKTAPRPVSSAPPFVSGIDFISNESVKLGQEALQRIIDFITTGARLEVKNGEDRVFFNVEGGDTGVLIGKRGQTLEAIQYLIEKIINKHSDERIRIQVDVEGYLEARRINLEGLAKRLAEKTRHTGKPSTLGQMNAHDRRIVHLTLKDDTEVRTQSMGDGFYRKLVIFPKRKNYRQKKMY